MTLENVRYDPEGQEWDSGPPESRPLTVAERIELAQQMIQRWLEFAAHGRGGSPVDPEPLVRLDLRHERGGEYWMRGPISRITLTLEAPGGELTIDDGRGAARATR